MIKKYPKIVRTSYLYHPLPCTHLSTAGWSNASWKSISFWAAIWSSVEWQVSRFSTYALPDPDSVTMWIVLKPLKPGGRQYHKSSLVPYLNFSVLSNLDLTAKRKTRIIDTTVYIYMTMIDAAKYVQSGASVSFIISFIV